MLLLASFAFADPQACTACCRKAGLEDCGAELHVVGDRSDVRQSGGTWSVTGLWVIGCGGTARYMAGSYATTSHRPRVGEIVGDDVSATSVRCFGDACQLPAQVCVTTVSGGAFALVDCKSFAPVGDALLTTGAPSPAWSSTSAAPSSATQAVKVSVDGRTIYAAAYAGDGVADAAVPEEPTRSTPAATSSWSPPPVPPATTSWDDDEPAAPAPAVNEPEPVAAPTPAPSNVPDLHTGPSIQWSSPAPAPAAVPSTARSETPSGQSLGAPDADGYYPLPGIDDDPIIPGDDDWKKTAAAAAPAPAPRPAPAPSPAPVVTASVMPPAPSLGGTSTSTSGGSGDLSLPPDPPATCRALSDIVAKEARRRVDAGDDRRMAADFAAAFKEYRAALTMDPCNANAWIGLGQSARSLGRADFAVHALKEATTLAPQHYGAWTMLGQSYEDLHQPAQAYEAYTQALALSPDYSPAMEGAQRTR